MLALTCGTYCACCMVQALSLVAVAILACMVYAQAASSESLTQNDSEGCTAAELRAVLCCRFEPNLPISIAYMVVKEAAFLWVIYAVESDQVQMHC